MTCASWRSILGALLLVGIAACGGGGGGNSDGDLLWTTWIWTGSGAATDPTPDLVSYNDGTQDITLMAAPGRVAIAFTAETTLAVASAAITSGGGELLDCIPEFHYLLAGVPPGTESAFISSIAANPTVNATSPDAAAADKLKLVAVEKCGTTHATRVSALLNCASGGSTTATCLDKTRPFAWKTLGALATTLFTNDSVVVNLSLGSPIPTGATSDRYIDWTSEEQQTYVATEYSIVSYVLRGLQIAQSLGFGKNTVLVFAAGNEQAPMDDVLARLRAEFGSTFANHVIFVGTPAAVYSQSNYVVGPVSDPNFILTDSATDAQPVPGTSLSAPRVAGLIGKMVGEQGLTAVAALSSVKQLYGNGTILPDPCHSGELPPVVPPDLTASEFRVSDTGVFPSDPDDYLSLQFAGGTANGSGFDYSWTQTAVQDGTTDSHVTPMRTFNFELVLEPFTYLVADSEGGPQTTLVTHGLAYWRIKNFGFFADPDWDAAWAISTDGKILRWNFFPNNYEVYVAK